MINPRQFLLIIQICLCSTFCNTLRQENPNGTKGDTLILRLTFSPAFNEHSEATLVKTDSAQVFQIIIKYNFIEKLKGDTFFFKKVLLTNHEYLELDSTLVKICRQIIPAKKHNVLDGMPISSLLIHNKDTNAISFHSPSQNSDSIGYNFSKSVLAILRVSFNDTLVSQYLDDIESYIDDSKWQPPNPKRKIDQMRMKKYNWEIRSPS